MNAIVYREKNEYSYAPKNGEEEDWPSKLFYRFCIDTGKNYWLISTALGFGFFLKEDLVREFRLYAIEQATSELSLLEMKIRRDERYRSNPFYRG